MESLMHMGKILVNNQILYCNRIKSIDYNEFNDICEFLETSTTNIVNTFINPYNNQDIKKLEFYRDQEKYYIQLNNLYENAIQYTKDNENSINIHKIKTFNVVIKESSEYINAYLAIKIYTDLYNKIY